MSKKQSNFLFTLFFSLMMSHLVLYLHFKTQAQQILLSTTCNNPFLRQYLLSAAMDSVVRLWELATGRCLIAYTGAGTIATQSTSTSAIFNHTEDFVMFPDEATTSLCSWESRTGQRKNLLSLGRAWAKLPDCHSNAKALICKGHPRD